MVDPEFIARLDTLSLSSPGALQVLQLASVLAPAPVPFELFEKGKRHLPTVLKAAMESSGIGQVLAPLTLAGFVSVDKGFRSFTVEPQARDLMSRALPDDVKARTLTGCLGAIMGALHEFDLENLSLWNRLLPHVVTVTESVPDDANKARVLNEAAYLSWMIGDSTVATAMYAKSLAIYESVLEPEHPYIATALRNLALQLHRQGSLTAARPLYERELAVRRKNLGSKHPDLAAKLNNLGRLLADLGDWPQARLYYEEALAIRESTLGPDHPNTAESLSSLADILLQQGDLSGARTLLERALTICERTLGPESIQTAVVLDNLATTLRRQGDLGATRVLRERALAIHETLDPDSPTTAASLNNFGFLLTEEGKFSQALELYRRALEILQSNLPDFHPDVTLQRRNLGFVYKRLGQTDVAEELYRLAKQGEAEFNRRNNAG